MLNFATIGSGWITDEYINGAKDTGLWKLTAVYSRSAQRAEEYGKKHGAEHVFTDLEEMAKSDKFDAVYISSPNYLHYHHCKLFLENKKHVICEKPFCAQSDKLKELFKIAEENNVLLLEAIMYMHLPQQKLLTDAISKIGNLSLIKIDFCQRSSKLDSYLKGELPNIFNPKMETGAFMDLGVYCVYPALHLFGIPRSFSADVSLLSSGADGMGIITMNYPDKLVTLTFSKISQAIAGSEFQGTKGTVYVDSISRLADIRIKPTDEKSELLYSDEEKYKLMGYEAKDFYCYITDSSYKEEYKACKKLSLDVSAFMESVRRKAGIKFDSD